MDDGSDINIDLSLIHWLAAALNYCDHHGTRSMGTGERWWRYKFQWITSQGDSFAAWTKSRTGEFLCRARTTNFNIVPCVIMHFTFHIKNHYGTRPDPRKDHTRMLQPLMDVFLLRSFWPTLDCLVNRLLRNRRIRDEFIITKCSYVLSTIRLLLTH